MLRVLCCLFYSVCCGCLICFGICLLRVLNCAPACCVLHVLCSALFVAHVLHVVCFVLCAVFFVLGVVYFVRVCVFWCFVLCVVKYVVSSMLFVVCCVLSFVFCA